MTFQNNNFLISSQLTRHPLIKLFHLSNLLQMSNDGRITDTEFFGNFSIVRIVGSFDDGAQLVGINF